MWKPTTTNDGQWRWDGYGWIPQRGWRATPRSAKRSPSAGLLLGLLVVDLFGFVPGVGWAPAAAAALVLLLIDGRGLVTLNGLIKWRRMSFELKLLALFLEIALFQFVVAAYIVLRLVELAKWAWLPEPTERSNPIALNRGTEELQADVGPRDADTMKSALDAIIAQAKNQLPGELLEQLRAVVSVILDILPAYGGSDLTAHDRFVVERTVDDYLPSALNTYLKLPPAYRSLPLREADGKTANELLSEQLDLLLRRMTELADTAYRQDVDALLIHGRFLRSKFGPSNLTVKT